MDELTVAEGVLILKPLCQSFYEKPSPEKAEEIAKLIGKTPNTIVRHVDILPLVFHLRNNTFSKDDNIKLIEAIRAILLKIRLDNLKLFFELYRCLRLQISKVDQSLILIEGHEELKKIVVLCLGDLIKSSSSNIIEHFYSRQYAALISHGVYLCILLARLEKSILLRINAIETAMILLQVHDAVDLQDVVLQSHVADVIMLCLPGIVKGFLEITLGNNTQNHKITMVAIRAWSRVIGLVMRDLPQEESSVNTFVIKNILQTKNVKEFEAIKNIIENTIKTPEWYAKACEKFNIVFKELDVITNHSNFKVRQELSTGVSYILLNCSKNIKPCFETFIEILIVLSEDENKQVADQTIQSLKDIQESCFQIQEMKPVVEILEENLYHLLTKMPRIIRTSGETSQLVWLSRLSGYLKILGKQRLCKILLSSVHLRKLLLTLVNIAELDCTNISLLEDNTTLDLAYIVHKKNVCSWKNFKFLLDTFTIEKLNVILQCLGKFGDRKIIIESILRMTQDLPKFSKELILILNIIIGDSTEQIPIFKQLIEYYITSDFWNQPTKISNEINIQTAQQNVVHSCLLLEGLGVMAKLLQEDFHQFLFKTLYLVTEKAGSECYLLRQVGLETLQVIAKSQKQDTIEHLFQNNLDFILYHVTVKLRHIERNPRVLDVIRVVTTYSTMDFLPHLKSIVDDILLKSSSNIQKRHAYAFLQIFYAFVICMRKLTTVQNFESNEKYFNEMRSLRVSETILNNFLDYYKTGQKSSSYENEKTGYINHLLDDIMEENFNQINTDKEIKVKIPKYINITKNITKKCLHFLPSSNFIESSLAMSILKEGVLILKDFENELLPLVHEIWHPLVDRFKNSNPLIIKYAWYLLCSIAQVANNFIRSRTLRQILPSLSIFLKKSSKESYRKNSSSICKFSQVFKLQKEILSQLGNFVKNLELLEKDTWYILSISEPYLDSDQHPELQGYCINMYEKICNYDIDMVWMKCLDIWNRNVEPVTPEIIYNYRLWFSQATDCNINSNYRENAQKILNYIYKKFDIL